MYERLLRDIKKTLFKVLGKAKLPFDQLEAVVVDLERNVNNRPLTYVEMEQEESHVLTPNTILLGQNVYTVEELDANDDEVSKLDKRVKQKRDHAWQRWKLEYLHSLMEQHRVRREKNACPQVGEVVLVVGDEKNRADWKKGKVVRLVKGQDGVVRGVKILTKGHLIERPLSLICSLELKSNDVEEESKGTKGKAVELRRSERQAAKCATEKVKCLLQDEEQDSEHI